MWIGNIHVNITKGDYIFAAWEKDDYKKYRKTLHELRCQGYRLIGITHDYLNTYYHYRRKGNKKRVVTVTMMEC